MTCITTTDDIQNHEFEKFIKSHKIKHVSKLTIVDISKILDVTKEYNYSTIECENNYNQTIYFSIFVMKNKKINMYSIYCKVYDDMDNFIIYDDIGYYFEIAKTLENIKIEWKCI